MRKFLPYLCCTLLLFSKGAVFSQSDRQAVLDRIAAKLVTSLQSKKEMIYLHVDKPYHLAGTTIWFRAYLLNQQSQLPSTQSRVIYVDLLDEEMKLIDQAILYARDLELGGGFRLPEKLNEGNYFLRAYSHLWPADAPETFIVPVYIINADQDTRNTKPVRNWKTAETERNKISFYPEGGNLINGIDCIVGVKATDADGKPAAVNGIIKDNRDTVVAKFQTAANGLGKFMFNPYKNRKYRAILKNPNQQELTIDLPALSNNAYQLALTKQDSQKISFRVGLSDPLYERKAGTYLIGVSRGRVAFASIGSGMYNVDIPLANFPEGIADFYLFDEQQNEVSRRRVWVDNGIKVTVSPNKTQYYQRSTVSIDISLTDKSGKPLVGLFSVSVTDNNMISPSNQLPTIVEYNFANKAGIGNNTCIGANYSSMSTELADLILMTGNYQQPLMNLDGKGLDSNLSIRGKLLYKNAPLANQSISLISSQQADLFRTDTTDTAGNFHFSNLNYFDSTLFYIQVDNPKIDFQELTIKLDSFPSTALQEGRSLASDCTPVDQLNSGIQLFKKNNVDSFLLGNTREWLKSIGQKGKKPAEGKNSNRNKFSRVITREQLSKLEQSTTANAVKMVPGVMMVAGSLTIRGGTPSLSGALDGNIEPLVVVDGVQAATGGSVVNYLNSIPPNIIEYIEVLTGPEGAQYGSRAANGVIVIKTGQPQFANKKLSNAISLYPKGYHVSPDFYMPDYSNEKVKEAEFKDNRSTIYWNGSVWTNNNGKASIQFYTADAKTTYLVTVMGVTSMGDLVMKQVVINRN